MCNLGQTQTKSSDEDDYRKEKLHPNDMFRLLQRLYGDNFLLYIPQDVKRFIEVSLVTSLYWLAYFIRQ